MYHQLNRITGRLVAATHLQAPLFPISPAAVTRVEVPSIVYTTSHMSSVAQACPAPGKVNLIPGTNIPYPPVSQNIKKLQKQFQTEDDIPVHLKGGPFDNILYRFTMLLCIVGIAGVLETVYSHAVPKK